MRLDRLLTLYFFHPLRRLLGREEGVRIPILMYHSISGQGDPGRHPYFHTNTCPDVFARHMRFLADNHYTVITLSEAVSLLSDSPIPNPQWPNDPISPRKYCVLTWDDGYRDFYDEAWPVLKRHGYPATMFLPTGFIGDERNALNGRDCLTWDEVKALAAEGAAFGAHTVSHLQLHAMDRQGIDHELQASKRDIEEKLKKEVRYYSYAYAFPEQDRAFVEVYEASLRAAGYGAAVSTRIGTAERGDNPCTLKRIPVNTCDDEALFRAKLDGGYDWLARPQALWKNLKQRAS